jgi:hypothetical protein
LVTSYTISPTNPDGTPNPSYNITTQDDTIIIPANIAMTDFAGIIKMTLIIGCDNNSSSVSIPFYYTYTVSPLAGYNMVGGNTNVQNYANIGLDNVANTVFYDKIVASGGIDTAAEVRDKLQTLTGNDRLNANYVQNIENNITLYKQLDHDNDLGGRSLVDAGAYGIKQTGALNKKWTATTDDDGTFRVINQDNLLLFNAQQDGRLWTPSFDSDAVNSELVLLDGRLDVAETDITALDSRLDTAESNITSLEGRTTTAEGNITSLDGRVDLIEPEIVSLDGRLDAVEPELVSLDSRLDTAESNIISLDGRLDIVEPELVSLDGRLDTAETNVTSLGNRVTTLESIDRIKVALTSNLTVTTTSQIIAFNSVFENNVITNSLGEITVLKSGQYVGNLSLYIDQNNSPELYVYVEKWNGSAWTVPGNTMVNIRPTQDSSHFTTVLNGVFTLNSNDKIRIRILRGGGTPTATLTNSTVTVGGTTLTQYPALLTFYKL